MVDAPLNLTYGTVTGKYLLSVLDSADIDRYPDYVAATGTVTFTPNVRSYKNLSIPATFATSSIICTIDSFGDLRDPSGGLGVVLVASDNADMQPRDWTYNVQVSVSGSVESFPILVTGGAVLDLTIVGPAVVSGGTSVVVSSADRILAQQAAAAAAVSAAEAAQSAEDAASSGGGGGGLDTEAVQDTVGTMVGQAGYALVTYNDGAGTLTIGTTSALQTALDGKAPLNSPTFTGSPVVPGYVTTATHTSDLNAKAPLASPAFTGNPTAPTPSSGDNDTSLATTAFVTSAIAGAKAVFVYDAATDTWPGAPVSTLPVLWISTNDSGAIQPPAMRDYDVWVQHPDAVI